MKAIQALIITAVIGVSVYIVGNLIAQALLAHLKPLRNFLTTIA